MPRKTDKLTIRIATAVKAALREVAEAEYRSISNMVEVMILERHERKRFPSTESSGKQKINIRVPSKNKKGAAE